MSEINDLDDLNGMLPSEILAVVQRLTAERDRYREGLQEVLTVLGPASCKCEGQQADVDMAILYARSALSGDDVPSDDQR